MQYKEHTSRANNGRVLFSCLFVWDLFGIGYTILGHSIFIRTPPMEGKTPTGLFVPIQIPTPLETC